MRGNLFLEQLRNGFSREIRNGGFVERQQLGFLFRRNDVDTAHRVLQEPRQPARDVSNIFQEALDESSVVKRSVVLAGNFQASAVTSERAVPTTSLQ